MGQKCPKNVPKVSQLVLLFLRENPGEYNVKSIYLGIRNMGYKISYDAVSKTVQRLYRNKKLLKVKRGYYTLKNVPKMGQKMSQFRGRGVPIAAGKLLPSFRLQNVMFYNRNFVKVGCRRELVYRGVRISMRDGCIYVSSPDGMDLVIFLSVCGFIDNILWSYKMSLDQFMVKRFEVISDIRGLGFDLSRLKGLYFREWLDNIIYKVYFKKDRIRSEFVYNEGRISFRDLSKILDMKLNSGVVLYELAEYMKSLAATVESLANVLHYVLQNQIEMSKIFNKFFRKDRGVYV